MGGKTAVNLRNTGKKSYTYNPYYEACQMVLARSFDIIYPPRVYRCQSLKALELETKRLSNAVTIAPGETEELTWRFDEPGEVLYGCHESDHLLRRPGGHDRRAVGIF